MIFTPDELRLLGVAGPTLLRMLQARETRILDKMYGEFRNGKVDHLTAIAEFASVRDQLNEITSALRQNQNQRK